jgi:activator of HSP90 ATPase
MNKGKHYTAQALSRRQAMVACAVTLGGVGLASPRARAATKDEISHSAESIHEEAVFKASRKRVYEALTDDKLFNGVTQLSAAMQSGALGKTPTQIGRDVGDPFSLFGGYIVGRQLELVPHERIVQAWRAASWGPGAYSIVKFELVEQGSETKLVLDHGGFPKGQAEHLAAGWKLNYWQPLEKFLA